jgi:hypothetical protein
MQYTIVSFAQFFQTPYDAPANNQASLQAQIRTVENIANYTAGSLVIQQMNTVGDAAGANVSTLILYSYTTSTPM